MSDDTPAGVWLYQDGGWELADDPVPWSGKAGEDVSAKYAEAGYSEFSRTAADPFLVLGLNSGEARPAAQFTLFVRREHPECLIDIEGAGGRTRAVYAARLPDGLDLLARWAPIAQAGVLTALAGDLFQAATDRNGRPFMPLGGLVEGVMRRAAEVS
ncbi:MAG: hypothetical protein M3Z75_13705 [Actinomycetota bacterium]|nr:hypothetical protein [Actinomycetota bacterium]